MNHAFSVSVPEQYEQLLKHLSHAEQELASGGSAVPNPYLEKASGVVFDLLYALDVRAESGVVPRLAAVYSYIGNQLLTVGKTKDGAQLAHLRDMIMTLRHAFVGIDRAA